MGFPVLSARLIQASDGTYSIGVKQRRFLADSEGLTPEEASAPWRLPVNVCTMEDSSKLLLRKVLDSAGNEKATEGDSSEVLFPLPDFTPSVAGVRVNPEAIAFCRVDYSPPMLEAIFEAIAKGLVPEHDRIAFLDDQFHLARAGVQSTTAVLQHCRSFAGEQSWAVWSVLSEGLRSIRSLVEEASYPSKDEVTFPEPSKEICGLNKLCIELAFPVYEKIGFDAASTDSMNESLLRPIIVGILAKVGHSGVVSKARDAFERHYKAVMAGETDAAKLIPPDMRATVYSTCMRDGGDVEFQKLLEVRRLPIGHFLGGILANLTALFGILCFGSSTTAQR